MRSKKRKNRKNLGKKYTRKQRGGFGPKRAIAIINQINSFVKPSEK